MKAKRCDINSNTATICSFCQGSQGCTQHHSRGVWKGPSDLYQRYQTSGEAQYSTTGYSYLVIPYGEHYVEWWQMFCLWQDRSYWSPLPWCAALLLHWFWEFHPGLLIENSSIRNTSSPWETMLPKTFTTMTIGTNHNLSITDTGREITLTGQGHSTDLNVAEAPATTRGTHPTPYPTTAAVQDTHQLTDALGNTLPRSPCTGTVTTIQDTTLFLLESLLWLFYRLKLV